MVPRSKPAAGPEHSARPGPGWPARPAPQNVTGPGYNTDMPGRLPPTRPDLAEPAPPGGPMTPPLPPPSAWEPRSRVSGSAGRPAVLPLVPGFERAPTRRRPLPDAAAVGLLLVPDSAPPYDDRPGDADHHHRPSGSAEPDEPSESLERLAPPGSGEPPAPPEPQERPVPPGPGPRPGGQVTAACWPSQFAQVLAETLAGSRSQGQIAPWTTDRARRRIRQLGPMLAAGAAPRVRRVVTSRPAAGVVEMTVIVGCGPKVRALAVRLERDGQPGRRPGPDAGAARWICTAVEAA
jgi:Family of unknown function (DUF6459)